MIGWLLNSISGPDLTAHWARLETIKVKNDLLAATIARKLGRPVHVKDLYTKETLRFKEEDGRMSHPGADNLFDTADDIILKKTSIQ